MQHQQLSVPKLIEIAIRNNEGKLASNGAFVAETGKYTGRSPGDRFIVDDELTHDIVDWGKVNQMFDQGKFDQLHSKILEYLETRETFRFDGYVGADEAYRQHIRLISEFAWHSLFAHQLFLRPEAAGEMRRDADFTIIDAPGFMAVPERDGTKSSAFIIISFARRTVLIGGTEYAGEIKKSAFSIMNFLLPKHDVFPMHCSANSSFDGNTALFFGLSGTGKTTLSADPKRKLIGDDEHGWSDNGIFNFEGGCYAKAINLTSGREPEIWNAIRFGTVLENVVLNVDSNQPDYADSSLTENTRAAYPLDYIANALIPSVGKHPKAVIFLTADAFGVLPPVSILTEAQAEYHFLSGYTSKLAGTELGVTEPTATFSTCFGAPFMPLPASVYASMLGERLRRHGAKCYLVNTGWSGGPYSVGSRIRLEYTRAIITAVLEGSLDGIETEKDSVFGLAIPKDVRSVPREILNPRNSWADPNYYDRAANHLAGLFISNFDRFQNVGVDVKSAGPNI